MNKWKLISSVTLSMSLHTSGLLLFYKMKELNQKSLKCLLALNGKYVKFGNILTPRENPEILEKIL